MSENPLAAFFDALDRVDPPGPCPHWFTEPAGLGVDKCTECGALIDADWHDQDHA